MNLPENTSPDQKGAFERLSREDLQRLYDHLGTMPYAEGSWSNNWRSVLSEALHEASTRSDNYPRTVLGWMNWGGE